MFSHVVVKTLNLGGRGLYPRVITATLVSFLVSRHIIETPHLISLYLVATWWLYCLLASLRNTLARPKSAIFKCPVELISKLAGFRSWRIATIKLFFGIGKILLTFLLISKSSSFWTREWAKRNERVIASGGGRSHTMGRLLAQVCSSVHRLRRVF